MNHGYKSSILVYNLCSYIRFALISVGTTVLRSMCMANGKKEVQYSPCSRMLILGLAYNLKVPRRKLEPGTTGPFQ